MHASWEPPRIAIRLLRVPTIRILLSLSLLVCVVGCASEKPISYHIESKFGVRDPEFAREMGSLLGPAIIKGNSCKTLVNGEEIFPAMLEAIGSAQKSINFETFILWRGKVGCQFTDALCERARAGVKVHVLLDWFGTDKIDPRFVPQMRQAGVHVVVYHPFSILNPGTWGQLDYRTHRKLLIVDGKVGFTGGAGIADEWSGNADSPNHWRDNHYMVRGPIVAQLQAAFQDNWIKTSGEVLRGNDYFPPLSPAGPLPAQVFKSSNNSESDSMELMILLAVASARTSIRMESAYFVPDKLMEQYLTDAARRGVQVEVIVPGPHIDEEFVRSASRASWGRMMQAGIHIYEYQPTMLHAKQLIVDEAWVSIGSANLDNRSFRINDEANLNILNDDFAREQFTLFDADKAHSRRITYEQWLRRPFGEKFSDWFASLLDGEL